MTELRLPRGAVGLPAFFPDGTRGGVRCVDARDLEGCGVQGVVMNAFHLIGKPGSATIKASGGLNSFAGWKRPVITDSGGFQAFSLIRENPSKGAVRPDGIIFKGEKNKVLLTPEKCMASQASFGSDVFMCLDYCTHPDEDYATQRLAVERTVKWAAACKAEYEKIIASSPKKYESARPLLFGIIQGGSDKKLREECAGALRAIGFDGYGFGGWPLDGQGRLEEEILAQTAGLMPDETVKYAMGVGKPENIVKCHKMGYGLFDCVIPTREARNNRLYVFNEDFGSLGQINLNESGFHGFMYILDDKYRRDSRPISLLCDCHACANYSRAYVRHLIAVGDSTGHRLATIHNLRFYTLLTELLGRRIT
ncbi:MAG: tRNA-guanine transglycosylase [Defluviitaleaceae bacterium]|nr:tRNA-guanine transglycosylase [Defluviitaleaceae bacterium]